MNMARGPLVVEEDLVKVMQEGHLWGAGLDVTAEEPLPPESPLWEIPNLIITPHVGGQRASRIDDMTRLFLENSRRFQAGEALHQSGGQEPWFPGGRGCPVPGLK